MTTAQIIQNSDEKTLLNVLKSGMTVVAPLSDKKYEEQVKIIYDAKLSGSCMIDALIKRGF
jgi:hypothetical protein